MSLSERIKKLRESLPGSPGQEEFGKPIGWSRQNVSDYERGKSEPKHTDLEKLGKHYEVNGEWLLYGTGPMLKKDVKEPEPSNKMIDLLTSNNNTLQRTVNKLLTLLGEPELGKLNVLGGADSQPIIPLWETNPGTSLSAVA